MENNETFGEIPYETQKWYFAAKKSYQTKRQRSELQVLPWEDHFSRSKDDQFQYFEVYDLTMKAMIELIAFCDKYKFTCDLIGYSKWDKNTFTIQISKS
jgi:hypothetical protein